MATRYLVVPWRIAVNNFIHVWIALKYRSIPVPNANMETTVGKPLLKSSKQRSCEDEVANVVITKNKDLKRFVDSWEIPGLGSTICAY